LCSGKHFWRNVRSARIASEWLRSNDSQFVGVINEPVCIAINDSDLNAKVQEFFERRVSYQDDDDDDIRDLAMFTFSDPNDLTKFDDVMRSVLKIRVNIGLTLAPTV
jgi:hypothetical protein